MKNFLKPTKIKIAVILFIFLLSLLIFFFLAQAYVADAEPYMVILYILGGPALLSKNAILLFAGVIMYQYLISCLMVFIFELSPKLPQLRYVLIILFLIAVVMFGFWLWGRKNTCGGFGGKQCPPGYSCDYGGADQYIADAVGKCRLLEFDIINE